MSMNYDTETIDRAFREALQFNKPVDLHISGARYGAGCLTPRIRGDERCYAPSGDVWGTVYRSGYVELNLDAYRRAQKKEALDSPLPPEIAKTQTVKIIFQMKDQVNQLFQDAKKAGVEVSYFGDFMWDANMVSNWLHSGDISRQDKALWEISDYGSHLIRDKADYGGSLARYLVRHFAHHSLSRSFVIDFASGTVTRKPLEECAKEIERAWRNKR